MSNVGHGSAAYGGRGEALHEGSHANRTREGALSHQRSGQRSTAILARWPRNTSSKMNPVPYNPDGPTRRVKGARHFAELRGT